MIIEGHRSYFAAFLTVTGSGFEPNESIEIWLHSDPVLLSSGNASGAGTINQQVIIPSGTTSGAHQIEIRGAESGSLFLDLTVTLAATGTEATALVIIGGAALLIGGGLILLRRQAGRRTI